MSEWITDRAPTQADADFHGLVWVTLNSGDVIGFKWEAVSEGTPWQRCAKPEPYVKPKRYEAVYYNGAWAVLNHTSIAAVTAFDITSKEAAERIAAIYEEVMP